MIILIISFLAFLVFYFSLKSFYTAWEKRRLPKWSRAVTGLLAWAIVISFGGILYSFFELFAAFDMGLIFVALGATAFWKYTTANPELFDFPHMKFFIKRALEFESPLLKKENIFEELDKHEVRRVYRETTGKELTVKVDDDPLLRKMARESLEETEDRLSKAKRESRFEKDKTVGANKRLIEQMLKTPIKSPHLRSELQQLSKGTVVNITDSWKLNSLSRSSHELYGKVSEAIVHPKEKQLSLTIIADTITQQHMQSPPRLLLVKQEIYDFFQHVNQQDWMKPYFAFVATIECICSELIDDPFAGPKITELLKAEITTDELKQYQNRFYNAGELRITILSSSFT